MNDQVRLDRFDKKYLFGPGASRLEDELIGPPLFCLVF